MQISTISTPSPAITRREQVTVEYLADATDCVHDAITTLTKLIRLGAGEVMTDEIIKRLSLIARDLDAMRQQSRASHTTSAALASFLSSTVFQCQPSPTN